MRPLRLVAIACLPIAAVGIAVARGKKSQDVPAEEPAPPPPVEEPAAPPPPPLFPSGLPVVLDRLPAGLPSLSAQGCNACHYAAHDTWAVSAHASAGGSAAFRDAVRAAGTSTACTQCHAPLAAQHAELAAGYVDDDLARPRLQPNPGFDATLSGEGVTCAACHVRGDTILGPRASDAAPHPVTATAELADSAMCATCHQLTWPGADRPYYDTWGEWKGSAYAAAGVTCQSCHMARTSGTALPGKEGLVPSHAVAADTRRALSALVQLEKGTLQRGQALAVTLVLQNTGAGHSFPTGNPATVARVEMALLDAAGKDLAPAFVRTLGRTIEPTPPWRTLSDDRLAPGAQLSVAHSFVPSVKGAAGRGAIEVRVVKGGATTVLARVPVEVL